MVQNWALAVAWCSIVTRCSQKKKIFTLSLNREHHVMIEGSLAQFTVLGLARSIFCGRRKTQPTLQFQILRKLRAICNFSDYPGLSYVLMVGHPLSSHKNLCILQERCDSKFRFNDMQLVGASCVSKLKLSCPFERQGRPGGQHLSSPSVQWSCK